MKRNYWALRYLAKAGMPVGRETVKEILKSFLENIGHDNMSKDGVP